MPTCRQTSGLEVHHIDDWAKVKTHEFDNLILLCAVCHARATKKEIDRQAMLAYKANLRLLNGRYGDLERRVLDHFVRHPGDTSIVIDRSHAILLSYLVEDGLLYMSAEPPDGVLIFDLDDTGNGAPGSITMGPANWSLTDDGRAVVDTLRSAKTLD